MNEQTRKDYLESLKIMSNDEEREYTQILIREMKQLERIDPLFREHRKEFRAALGVE